MRVPIVVVLLLLLAPLSACGDDDEGAADDGTTTTTSDADTTTTTSNTTTTVLPGGELVACENPDGFILERPESWSTNEGCSQFDPEPFEIPQGTDERVAAITAFVDPVNFAEVAAPDHERDAERWVTAIDGLQAVRLSYEIGEEGLWPEGTPVTTYLVDLTSPELEDEPKTLFIDTVGLEGFDYERNQVVLDRMARTLEVTLDEIPTDTRIVASYQGGAGSFTVEGRVEDDEACLRIPPGGDEVCAETPDADGMHTIELVDIEPVLAGVTGEQVFRVTAERFEGQPSTVIPAPIGDSDVLGFSFVFGLDEVERFVLHDVTGDELDTIEPGA